MPSDSEDRNIEQPEESAVSEPVLTDDGKSLRHWLLVPAGVVGIAFVVGIVLYFLLTGGGIDEAPDALEAPTSTVAEPVLPPLSVGEMALRLYGALNYNQNNARDLRCALNGA